MHELIATIALSMGVAWASGINLYAAILVLGLLGATGHVTLPESLQVVQQPVVIGVAVLMYCVEFFADKIPGVDSTWDALHTFIRIPAGAVLAASAIADVDPSITLAAGLVGGGVTAGTHLTKASSRLLVNTLPEPFSNIAASLSEDCLAIGGLWIALHYPLVFLLFLMVFLILMLWLLPILWRALKGIIDTLRRFSMTAKPERLPER